MQKNQFPEVAHFDQHIFDLFAIKFTLWSHILNTIGDALSAYLLQSRLCVLLNNTIEIIKRCSYYKVSVVHVNGLGLTYTYSPGAWCSWNNQSPEAPRGAYFGNTLCLRHNYQHQALAEFFSFFPNDTPDFPYPTMYHMENMKNKPAFENAKSCQSRVNWLVIAQLKTQRNFVIWADLSCLWVQRWVTEDLRVHLVCFRLVDLD